MFSILIVMIADRMIDKFIEWGGRMIDRLHSLGMWADLTDPASGFPVGLK